MKEKLLLLLFGTGIGVSLGLGSGWVIKRMLLAPPAGSTFASTDDLRRTMMSTDEKDVKEDGSVSLRSIIRPHPSDRIIYTLKPNLRVKFQRVELTTNSEGLRGPEINVEKPKGVYRIAFLGDSFVFGWGVAQAQTFVQVFQDLLNEHAKELGYERFEVLNFGVPGYSTFQEVALFEEEGLKYKPDAAILYFVENDFGLPFFINDFSNPEALVAAGTYKDLHRDLPTEEKARKKALHKLISPNRSFERWLEVSKPENVRLFVTVNPNKKADKMHRLLSVLPHLPEIQYLDIRPGVKAAIDSSGQPVESFSLHGDPHPSESKHKLIAAELYKKFSEQLLDIKNKSL